jgi:hypothetical protein
MATTATLVPADPKRYVWHFPGSPIKVQLDLQVVQRLKERLRGGGARTSEEGLLFGGALDGAVEIRDFQPASNGNVANLIAALPNEQRKRSLMGYYRTEEGETFHLNAKDVSLAEECFRKPHHVFLMIHSNGLDCPSATFFFHDGDRKMADVAFLEFPFDPALLAIEERDRIQRSQHAAMERSVKVPSPSPDPSTGGAARSKSRVLLKAAAWTCSIALVFALGTLVNYRSFRERIAHLRQQISNASGVSLLSPSASQSSSHPSMALHARRQNGDLELTWSRESALIATATSGVISIQDGESKRQVDLDSSQVRGGSLLYSPTSDQILMQLTVTTSADTATESVMVILPKVGGPQTYPLPASKTPPPTSVALPSRLDTVPLARASKPFTEPVAPGTPPPAPLILTDSPPLKLNLDPVATVVPAVVSQTPVPAPPAPAPPSQQPQPIIANYQKAVAITKAAPAFPREMQAYVFSRKVIEVKVTIDKNGDVNKAEAIPQKNVNQFLVSSAIKAAHLWRFLPARLNTEPTSSELILRFVFDERGFHP